MHCKNVIVYLNFRIKDGVQSNPSYQTYLINILISFYKWILSVVLIKQWSNIKSLEVLREVQNIISKDMLHYKESKATSDCKLNLISVKYNTAAVMYLMNQQEEWEKILKNLTSSISSEFVLIDEGVLQKIYLLKWYWNLDKDYLIANNDAKMAIELEKAWQINSLIDYIMVSLNPQMPQISTFDENIDSEFVINMNTRGNVQNSQYNMSKEYKFKSANNEESEISNQ